MKKLSFQVGKLTNHHATKKQKADLESEKNENTHNMKMWMKSVVFIAISRETAIALGTYSLCRPLPAAISVSNVMSNFQLPLTFFFLYEKKDQNQISFVQHNNKDR